MCFMSKLPGGGKDAFQFDSYIFTVERIFTS